jgi:hypothetical protein
MLECWGWQWQIRDGRKRAGISAAPLIDRDKSHDGADVSNFQLHRRDQTSNLEHVVALRVGPESEMKPRFATRTRTRTLKTKRESFDGKFFLMFLVKCVGPRSLSLHSAIFSPSPTSQPLKHDI